MGSVSQSQLARDMTAAGYKMTQPTISRILDGGTPDTETAQKLADYFHVSVGQILGKEFYAPPNPDEYLSPEARLAARLFEQLPPDIQDNCLAILRALIQTNKKTKT